MNYYTMKKLNNWKKFNENMLDFDLPKHEKKPNPNTEIFMVKKVERDEEYKEYIQKISVKDMDGNDLNIVAGEDTGGEYATLSIKNGDIKEGDEIQFEQEFVTKAFDNGSEVYGVEDIWINGEHFKCAVVSEGGNTGTFLYVEEGGEDPTNMSGVSKKEGMKEFVWNKLYDMAYEEFKKAGGEPFTEWFETLSDTNIENLYKTLK